MAKSNNFCSGISQKWVFAVMGFCAILCTFAMRLCLPLTITKMVKAIEHRKEYHDDTCPSPNVTLSTASAGPSDAYPNTGIYEWSEYTQGIILGSFYWGYVLSHVPGGIMAERFGGKHTLGLGILATAICTLLTPLSIVWGGSDSLIGLRIFMGLCEGITLPAISVMLAQWVPADERSKISSFVFMGATFGVLMPSLGLGALMRSSGWPGVYYAFGGLGVLWYLLWTVLCYNRPSEHPFISEREARELEAKLSEHTHADAPPVPWRHLLTSPPFWALAVASVGRDWAGYILISDLPKYTMNVLRFTDEENGILYLSMNVGLLVSCLLFSWLSDWLIVREYASRTRVRKLTATLGMVVHAGFTVLAAYAGCDKLLYTVLLCVSVFLMGAGFPGVKSNVLDLSPNYAGTVMAISHGLSGLCGIAAPYVVGILVPNETLSEWRLVYWIMFIIMIFANIVFVLFASGEVQEWNDPNFERKKTKDKLIELKEVEQLLTVDKIQIVATEGIN